MVINKLEANLWVLANVTINMLLLDFNPLTNEIYINIFKYQNIYNILLYNMILKIRPIIKCLMCSWPCQFMMFSLLFYLALFFIQG